MKIPYLWAVYDREYGDEGSILLWSGSGSVARRKGARLLQIPLAHVATSQMTLGALWRRWSGRR